jgi:hypothetical protein
MPYQAPHRRGLFVHLIPPPSKPTVADISGPSLFQEDRLLNIHADPISRFSQNNVQHARPYLLFRTSAHQQQSGLPEKIFTDYHSNSDDFSGHIQMKTQGNFSSLCPIFDVLSNAVRYLISSTSLWLRVVIIRAFAK